MMQEGVHRHRGHGGQLGGGPERHHLSHAQAAHTLLWGQNKDIDKIADRNLEKGGVGFIQPEECGLQVGSVLQQCARHQPAVDQAGDRGQSGVSIQYRHHNQPITAQYSPAGRGRGRGRGGAGRGRGGASAAPASACCTTPASTPASGGTQPSPHTASPASPGQSSL